MPFVKKLAAFIDDAALQNVIDEEARQKLQNFATKYDVKTASSFSAIMGIFGGALIFLGMILIISRNWYEIHNFVKIFSYCATLVMLYLAAYALQEKQCQKTANAIYFAAAGYVLAGIGLIAQIYNLGIDIQNSLLLWSILILPLAIFLEDRRVGLLVAFGFYVWVCHAVVKDFGVAYFLAKKGNLVADITIVFSSMILLPRVLKSLNSCFEYLKSYGFFMLGLLVFILGFFNTSVFDIFFSVDFKKVTLQPIIIILLAFDILAIFYYLFKNFAANPKFSDLLRQPETIVAVLLLLSLIYFQGISFIYLVTWFGASAVMVYNGTLTRNSSLINSGSRFIAIGIMVKFVVLSKGFVATGFGFLFIGSVLIAIAFVGEKYRKNLVNKIS